MTDVMRLEEKNLLLISSAKCYIELYSRNENTDKLGIRDAGPMGEWGCFLETSFSSTFLQNIHICLVYICMFAIDFVNYISR